MFYCITHVKDVNEEQRYILALDFLNGFPEKYGFIYKNSKGENKKNSPEGEFFNIVSQHRYYRPLMVRPTWMSFVSGVTPSLNILVRLYEPNKVNRPYPALAVTASLVPLK